MRRLRHAAHLFTGSQLDWQPTAQSCKLTFKASAVLLDGTDFLPVGTLQGSSLSVCDFSQPQPKKQDH